MAEEKNTYAAKESEDSDTVHVHIENQESLRSDLEYLAEKMGISIEQLRQERYQAEKQRQQEEIKKRLEKKRRAIEAQEARLDHEFLSNYGAKDGHYLLTVGSKRIQKLKDFSELTCPECGIEMPLQGICRSIMEMYPMAHPYAPRSEFGFYPARVGSVRCRNRHEIKVVVQYII